MTQQPLRALIAQEVFLLLLTLGVGVVLVAGLAFLPSLFDSSRSITAESLGAYLGDVGAHLQGLLGGTLGTNARGRPANVELLVAGRRTLELLIASMLVTVPLGLAWGGLLATVRRGVLGALLFGLSTLLLSLPAFAALLLLGEAVATLTLRTGVRVAYVQGYGLDQHLILPTTVLALRGAAFLARALQVAQEEIMAQDWIRAARARGLGGFGLWRRHVLPALRLPLLAGVLGATRVIVGSMVIVDFLFNWGGLGRRLLQINGGVVSSAAGGEAAGAAVLLLVLFVAIDALGRLAIHAGPPR